MNKNKNFEQTIKPIKKYLPLLQKNFNPIKEKVTKLPLTNIKKMQTDLSNILSNILPLNKRQTQILTSRVIILDQLLEIISFLTKPTHTKEEINGIDEINNEFQLICTQYPVIFQLTETIYVFYNKSINQIKTKKADFGKQEQEIKNAVSAYLFYLICLLDFDLSLSEKGINSK